LHHNFSGKFGEIRQNTSHPKSLPGPTPMTKRQLRPVAPLLKGQRGNALAMPPFSGVPVHIILHALSLLVVVSRNVSLQWT